MKRFSLASLWRKVWCGFLCINLVQGVCELVSSEYDALESLYSATNGLWWKWKPIGPIWFNTSNPCYPVPWQGLTCKASESLCFIDTITLLDYNLTGILPDAIGDFQNLTTLELSSNHLFGSIPEVLGSLSKLNHLLLSNNTISGSIPEELYSLKNLSTLSLDSNYLNGTLSSSISKLTALNLLFLNLNRLSGQLPAEVFNLLKLNFIDMHGNLFTGPIPSTVGNAASLLLLDLANNEFDGTLPPELGKLIKLRDFHAQENHLTGSIPEELYNCASLVELILNHMPLSGTISKSISKLNNLGYLYLQSTNISGTLPDFPSSVRNLTLNNMQLNGSIPTSIFALPLVSGVELSTNKLTGSLPDQLGLCSSLRVFAADHNQLTGSLPSNFSEAIRLSEVYLQNNRLNGTIPKGIGQLSNLYNLQLNNNDLSGSIPVEFYSLTSLRNLDLSYNYLNGSISDRIGNMIQLISIVFYFNEITGSLPDSISNLTRLVSFECSNNRIIGHLPRSICHWQYLSEFYGQYNFFSGPLPECIFSTMNVSTFEAYNNLLTGSIPNYFTNQRLSNFKINSNAITGTLPSIVSKAMEYFDVEFNQFQGTIASSLFKVGKFLVVGLESNYLTGLIPSTVALPIAMNYFDIFHNYLSGTVPYMGNLRSLATFYVDQNFLSGPLSCFNSSNQQYLTNIDISVNSFTGTLPDDLFNVLTLETFSSVENCLDGSISEGICNAKNLLVLALDGMHTSVPCRYNLLNGNYALQYTTPGRIPPCLFNMPKIQTLHLSGNGIGGSLPYDLNVSDTLLDIALSYNQLTGSIPLQLQLNPFVNFDLSYNTFNGYLLPAIDALPANGSVYLEVNRLSGQIPEALLDVYNISILNSNMFECLLNRRQLPKHDSDYRYYQCGTSALEHSVYAFLGLLGVGVGVIFVMYVLVYYSSNGLSFFHSFRVAIVNSKRYVHIMTSSHQYRNIQLMNKFMNQLMSGVGILTCAIVLVLMPAYIGLSVEHSMFESKYAWIVSSVYLSGTTPAVTLFVLYVLLSVLLFVTLYRVGNEFQTVDTWSSKRSTIAEVFQRRYKQYVGIVVIALFNFSVVLIVNVGYILLSTRLSAQLVSFLQVLLATFKFIWNDMVVRNLTKYMHRYCTVGVTLSLSEERRWNGRYLTFNSYMLLFNVIIIPCLATAFVSTECFFNLYEQPAEVDSTVSFLSCSGYESVVAGIVAPNCTSYVEESFVTSYLPPFIYRYQCASTLVTTYAVVYVYKFILTAFLRPAAVLYCIRLDEQIGNNSTFHKLIRPLVLSIKHTTPLGKSIRTYLFPSDQFNLKLVMYLSILVTFGVMFPPLAVMVFITVVVHCYLTLLTLGRFVAKETVESNATVMSYLNQDAANTGVMFMKTVYVIGGPASFFYAYFVFDTYGDAVGARKALWMAVPMFVFGIICVVAFKLTVVANEKQVKIRSSDIDTVELGRPSSLMRSDVSSISDGDSVIVVSNPVHHKSIS